MSAVSPDLASGGPDRRQTISREDWLFGALTGAYMQEQETVERGAVPSSELQNRPRLPERHEIGFGPKAVHDLLGPLCAVTSVSAWIADEYSDRLGPEGREWLNRLQESVERMRAVIESWSHSPGVG